MRSTAKHKYLRIAPRKVRLVAEGIRGKKASEAQHILAFTTKRAAEPLQKALKSAIASAENNLQLNRENLYVEKIRIDEGPKLKRYRPRARGRAYPIEKKTSHITLVLNELVETTEAAKKKTKKPVQAQEVATETKTVAKPKFRPKSEVTTKAMKDSGSKRFFRRKSI